MARHILKLHSRGGGEMVIPPEKLKKYIIYAKKTCKPKLSDEAIKKIEDFYVELRSMVVRYKDETGTAFLPITNRQLESLVRLTEAHARMLLKDEADESDAEFAINLMKASLTDIGVDAETGQIDLTPIYSGMTREKASRYHQVVSIVKELSEVYSNKIPLSEVFKKAEDLGISEEVAWEVLKEEMRVGNIVKIDSKHIKLAL